MGMGIRGAYPPPCCLEAFDARIKKHKEAESASPSEVLMEDDKDPVK